MVFARAPVAGRVKTRLMPRLGAAGAAALHAKLTRRTVALAHSSVVAALELWCTPTVRDPLFVALRREFGLRLRLQRGADLGERMAHALEDGLRRVSAVVLVGTDCVDLGEEDLRQAFAYLVAGDDVVLGPAADGGYVLVGVRRPVPEIFVDIPWGTGEVLATTRARLVAAGRRWSELPVRHDLDVPEDLWRLEIP